MLNLIPDWLKLPLAGALGLILGAGLTFYPAKWMGASDERQATQIRTAKDALNRVQNLEKNNATFRNLSDRDRCLVFMRDSGLPVSACDER
ncbi:hypothetical protein F4V89_12845 [Neorhizobium galegae]|nr:hypothetical protein F4V89_12845 [Neorhizobium galegae]